ncbi:hypothetical protein RIVM261_077420 [Rivularia sp. IAM M-261]|nr:hypothetical protein RIVM261_077420 [Rivularia sp. IAM M-261]
MSFSLSTQVAELYEQHSSKQSQELLTQEKGFDYAVLSPQVQILVQEKTSELKSLMRRSAQDIIDIGQKLAEVKEQLGHGNFRAWLKAEFDWSVRTAARFMQVATQFECANLAHLNIAISALYLLAEPSTPEKARKQALELAKEGENITHTKAQIIVNHHKELAQPSACKTGTIDLSTKATKGNLLTLSQSCQSQNINSQLEPKDEANLAAIEPLETLPAIESDKRLEHKAVDKIESVLKQSSEVPLQLQNDPSDSIRVLNIKQQNLELVTNIAQTFELTFAGVRVDFEGYPEALLVLFEQMQNNPVFAEKVLKEAKSLAVNSTDFL